MLRRYEGILENVTGLMVGAEYFAQKTIVAVPPMVIARGKPLAINYLMFVKLSGMNGLKSALIQQQNVF